MTSARLCTDDGDNTDNGAIPDEIYAERFTLEQHKQSIVNVRNTIARTLYSENQISKVALANQLIEGDDKYSHFNVNRQNAQSILARVLSDQEQSLRNIDSLVHDLNSRYPRLRG